MATTYKLTKGDYIKTLEKKLIDISSRVHEERYSLPFCSHFSSSIYIHSFDGVSCSTEMMFINRSAKDETESLVSSIEEKIRRAKESNPREITLNEDDYVKINRSIKKQKQPQYWLDSYEIEWAKLGAYSYVWRHVTTAKPKSIAAERVKMNRGRPRKKSQIDYGLIIGLLFFFVLYFLSINQ